MTSNPDDFEKAKNIQINKLGTKARLPFGIGADWAKSYFEGHKDFLWQAGAKATRAKMLERIEKNQRETKFFEGQYKLATKALETSRNRLAEKDATIKGLVEALEGIDSATFRQSISISMLARLRGISITAKQAIAKAKGD